MYEPLEPVALTREAGISLSVGCLIAIIVSVIPFLRFVFTYLLVLIHEFGHALFFWLFGYPSVPAFDFTYGGGVAVHQGRQPFLAAAVFCGILFITWYVRKYRRLAAVLGGFGILYLVLAVTPVHDAIILFMGHGTEILFAGLCLYRALSGTGLKVPAERPLYGFCGWFILFQNFIFAVKLINDRGFRHFYENEAKGGGHWMDFSQLAENHLHIDLSTMTRLFALYIVLVLVGTWLYARYRPDMYRFFTWLTGE